MKTRMKINTMRNCVVNCSIPMQKSRSRDSMCVVYLTSSI
jgi:hypothetical protein